MFKISYKVKGDNLGQVLKPTAGIVSDLEIMPVENEPVRSLKAKTGNKTGKKSHKAAKPWQSSINYTERLGLPSGLQFKGKDIFPNIRAAGYSPRATWTYLAHEVRAGRIRRVGPGLYVVV